MVTYARNPSGVIAIPKGLSPTGIHGKISVLVVVLITETESAAESPPEFVT
ncbi:hypothetical protein PDJ89_07560 [Bacillus cereus]|nr:hypothetical protein [Bacillus cereus]